MNKKLSIIMLLSCVGNVFSSDNLIYVSNAESARAVAEALGDKLPTAIVACNKGGYLSFQLPSSTDLAKTFKNIPSAVKNGSKIALCKAGDATCSFFKGVGRGIGSGFSKLPNLSRGQVAALLGGTACAFIGGKLYFDYKKAANAAAASRGLLEEAIEVFDEEACPLAVPNVDLLASTKPKDYKRFVDMLIAEDNENALLQYGHVDGDCRTLLMLLSEAGQKNTSNLDALVYFKEQAASQGKTIDVNKKDNHGRTALFYAVHYGLENIVYFLIDELKAEVSQQDVDAASYKRYDGTTKEGCARIKTKLENTSAKQ